MVADYRQRIAELESRTVTVKLPKRYSCEGYHIDEAYLQEDPEGDCYDRDEVLEVLTARAPMKHVVVTGRNAADAVMEAADLVTEMTMVKHPFRSGIKGQIGIEF